MQKNKTLTSFENSTLAKFFMGDQDAKKVLSPSIKKENENWYFIARPLEMSENLFTFLKTASFYFKRGEGYDNQIQQFKEELNLYGLNSHERPVCEGKYIQLYW